MLRYTYSNLIQSKTTSTPMSLCILCASASQNTNYMSITCKLLPPTFSKEMHVMQEWKINLVKAESRCRITLN